MTPRASAAYQGLLPAAVAAFEMREPGDPAALMPAEARHLGGSVPSRAGEFAAGRLCARRALHEFGIDEFALRAADDRQPVWPDFIVGSITHTPGLCVAAVGERGPLLGIGIDSEAVARARPEVLAKVCVPAELEWVESLPADQRAAAGMMIFSAKEAFYKSQYPVCAEWLDFHDVRVVPQPWSPPGPKPTEAACFELEATRPWCVAKRTQMPVRGRYRFHEQFVSAAVLLYPAAD
jgi:4'-phosphopantetheinyl transferase EntD